MCCITVSVVCFFASRRRHTRYWRDWSSDVCSSDLPLRPPDDLVGQWLDRLQPELAHELQQPPAPDLVARHLRVDVAEHLLRRSEERRVGKECRSRWSPYP